jgi:hypothetical protein
MSRTCQRLANAGVYAADGAGTASCEFDRRSRRSREPLGHADIATTLRYAHLAPEHKRKAVDALLAIRPSTSKPAVLRKVVEQLGAI